MTLQKKALLAAFNLPSFQASPDDDDGEWLARWTFWGVLAWIVVGLLYWTCR